MTLFFEKTALEPMTVAGFAIRTTNENDQAVDDINALWKRFFEAGAQKAIAARLDDTIYAVYTDYEGDHTKPYRLIIGCVVDEGAPVPEGMVACSIPADQYASFKARGPQPQSLMQAWEGIWGADIKRTYKHDIEVYGPKFFEPGLNEVVIHVSVES